ncbi:MAG: prefoldin subunit alpha [Candidatus Nanoarchaeia archaeon]
MMAESEKEKLNPQKDSQKDLRKDLQKEYLTLRLLTQQIEEQLDLVNAQIVELTSARNALLDIGKISQKTKALVPLSRGVFIDAEILSVKDVLVNVGSSVFVRKSLLDAQKLVDEQIEQLNKMILELNNELIVANKKMQEIEAKFSKIENV